MPQITQEEYIRRALKFLEAHKDSYTEREYEYIKRNIRWGVDRPFISDLMRQVCDEVGKTDIYTVTDDNVKSNVISLRIVTTFCDKISAFSLFIYLKYELTLLII